MFRSCFQAIPFLLVASLWLNASQGTALGQGKDKGGKQREGKDDRFVTAASCGAISPDNKWALIGFKPGGGPGLKRYRGSCVLKLWHISSGRIERTLGGHEDGVTFVEFLPDGKRAISLGGDNLFRVWDIEKGSEVRAFGPEETPVLLAGLSPNGKMLLCRTSKRGLQVWDVKMGKMVREFAEHYYPLNYIGLSEDSRLALLGVVPFFDGKLGKNNDTTAQVLDLVTGQVLLSKASTVVPGKKIPLGVLQPHFVCPKKDEVVSGYGEGDERLICVWNMTTGKVLHKYRNGVHFMPRSIRMTFDGKRILGEGGGKLLCIDVPTGKTVWHREIGEQDLFIFNRHSTLAIAARGKASVNSNIELTVWDTEKGQMVGRLNSPFVSH